MHVLLSTCSGYCFITYSAVVADKLKIARPIRDQGQNTYLVQETWYNVYMYIVNNGCKENPIHNNKMPNMLLTITCVIEYLFRVLFYFKFGSSCR